MMGRALWRYASLWLLIHCDVTAFTVPPRPLLIAHKSNLFSSQKATRSSTCLRSSLTDLLQELDQRGIRYPPSASRAELKKLLSSHPLPLTLLLAQLDIRKIRYDPSASRAELEALLAKHNKNDSKPADRSSGGDGKSAPLNELRAELDRRQIHYSPSATLPELELLLKNSSRESTARVSSLRQDRRSRPVSKRQTQVKPLNEVLAELDRRQVRYPPSATRPELELLLKNSQATKQEQEEDQSNDDKTVPLNELLAELNRRQVRYPPSATRRELELLVKKSQKPRIRKNVSKRRSQSQTGRRSRITVSEDILEMETESADRSQRRRKRRQNQPSQLNQVWSQSSVLMSQTANSIPRKVSAASASFRPGLSNLASRASKRVKNHVRKRVERPKPEEPAPSMETRSIDEPIDVEAVRIVPPRRKLITPTTATYQLPPPPQPEPTPRSEKKEDDIKTEKPKDRPKRRTVFSPYAEDDRRIDNKDAFDRIGDAVAGAAEAMLWGPDEEDTAESSTEKKRSKRRMPRTHRQTNSQARYWKDRMEEQVDHLMGLHDDESTYTTWEDYADESSKRKKRRSKVRVNERGKKKTARKPIWEEEGSLVSLLFGRRPSGGQLRLEEIFERKVGTNVLTNFISSILKGGLLVASYLCRWASVKGAIPQPVVVMAIVSAALSARRRISTVFITLLVLRTIGELIHGYIQGDDEWEDYDLATEGPAPSRSTGDGSDAGSEESWDGDGL